MTRGQKLVFTYEKQSIVDGEAEEVGLMLPLLWTSADAGCNCHARTSCEVKLPSYRPEPIFGDLSFSRFRGETDPVGLRVFVTTYEPDIDPSKPCVTFFEQEKSRLYSEWMRRCLTATRSYLEDHGWRHLSMTMEQI